MVPSEDVVMVVEQDLVHECSRYHQLLSLRPGETILSSVGNTYQTFLVDVDS